MSSFSNSQLEKEKNEFETTHMDNDIKHSNFKLKKAQPMGRFSPFKAFKKVFLFVSIFLKISIEIAMFGTRLHTLLLPFKSFLEIRRLF